MLFVSSIAPRMQTEMIHFELSQTICFYCLTSFVSDISIAHIKSYRLNNLLGCDMTFFFLFLLAGTLYMTPMSKLISSHLHVCLKEIL